MVIELSIYIKKHIRFLILTMIFGLFFAMKTHSQEPEDFSMLDSLPLNPDITHGKLENGFTYYICKNKDIKDDIVLMEFLVKAGSRYEDQDQKEVAHAIEHIPFNSTTHYPYGIWQNKNANRLGITKDRVGASTLGDYTRFYFNFQRQNIEALRGGLIWFQDIAGHLEFKKETIGQVTQEVLEEFRFRTRGSMKISGNSNYSIYPGSKDLSSPDIFLNNHTSQVFQRFYQDWYRPNNMALFIVGNPAIQESEIIEEIKIRFSSLANPSQVREKRDFVDEYLNQEEKRIFLQDSSLSEARLGFYFRMRKLNNIQTKKDIQGAICRELMVSLLDKRLKNLQKRYPPIAREVYTETRKDYPVFYVDMKIDSQGALNLPIMKVIEELKRVREYGFTEPEFNEAKKRLKQNILKNGKSNKIVLEGCQNHFLVGEASPKKKTEILLSIINKLERQNLSSVFSEVFTPDQRMDFVCISPERMEHIQGNMIDTWKNKAWEVAISPYQEPPKITRLMNKESTNQLSEQSYERKDINEVGVTELNFKNGVRVVLKPFTPKGINADKIMFECFSPGGASLYKEDNYYSALNAGSIIQHYGINGFNKFQLDEYLSRRESYVAPYIKHQEEGMQGRFDNECIEEFLQLIYLYFTKPNKIKRAYQDDWLTKRYSDLLYMNDNDEHFKEVIAKTLGNAESLNLSKQLNELDNINFETAYQIYKERFANAGDFIFVFTGDFELKEMISLVSRYIGSLPDQGIRDKSNKEELNLPKGPYAKNIYAKSEFEGAFVKLCFIEEGKLTVEDEVSLFVMTRVLSAILQRRLRYQDGAKVYFARVSNRSYKSPDWYNVEIKFECALENVEELVETTWEELERLKEKGIDKIDFEKAIDMVRRYYYANLDTNNRRVLEGLVEQYRNNEHPKNTFVLQRKFLNEINLNNINSMTYNIFNKENYFRFVLQQGGHNTLKK